MTAWWVVIRYGFPNFSFNLDWTKHKITIELIDGIGMGGQNWNEDRPPFILFASHTKSASTSISTAMFVSFVNASILF